MPPNVLFAYDAGHPLTLRKLAGQPVRLVFWKSASTPSIAAVRDLSATASKTGGRGPVVLAVNDGDSPELAKRVAAGAQAVGDDRHRRGAPDFWRVRREHLADDRLDRCQRIDRRDSLRLRLGAAVNDMNTFLLLTPILVLAAVALLGFAGCGSRVSAAADEPTGVTATAGNNRAGRDVGRL